MHDPEKPMDRRDADSEDGHPRMPFERDDMDAFLVQDRDGRSE